MIGYSTTPPKYKVTITYLSGNWKVRANHDYPINGDLIACIGLYRCIWVNM